MPRIRVAGIPVDAVTFQEAAALARSFLESEGGHLVVTPNPEMAVLASRDPEFLNILEASDLALPDGFGLRIAARVEGKRIPETITGVDFALVLAEIAEQKNYSVYFLGAEEGIAGKAAAALRKAYPRLRIAGAESGGPIHFSDGTWREDPGLLSRIRDAGPDLLLVALGHGKQERWIRDHLADLPSVRLAIGLGGAFDYFSGAKKRAPKLFRALHVEWLWRLLAEPWRLPRILNALVVFSLLVLSTREKRVQ